jgi:hypothetical protein
MNKLSIVLLFSIVVFASCNKDKRNSNRLINKGPWQVTTLTVNGVSDSLLPIITFDDCNIYEDTCTAQWMLSSTRKNEFIWQFNDRANTFTISRQFDEDTIAFVLDIVKWQCYQYSGTYHVIKAKRNNIEFESSTTVGYSGQKVRMVIEKSE